MPEFRCEQKVGRAAEGMAVQRLGDGSPGRPGHGKREEHTLTSGVEAHDHQDQKGSVEPSQGNLWEFSRDGGWN